MNRLGDMESANFREDIEMNHTFVICAYKESQYLQECIDSLKDQEIKSGIIMVTSTPCEFIEKVAEANHIPLFVNEGEGGITQDWNFGLSKVKTKYATIAHQDDVYESTYLKEIRKNCTKDTIIAFTDYCELRNGEKIYDNLNLKIKRIMLAPLRIKELGRSKFVRRRILSLGDPICCPSVTFNLKKCGRPIFHNHFRSCEDWEAWEKLSKCKGRFSYVSKPLMCHRIHEESETTSVINDNVRVDENLEMYMKFWPESIAKLINKFYTKSENSNEV